MPLSKSQWEEFGKSAPWREFHDCLESALEMTLALLSRPDNTRDYDQFLKGRADVISDLMQGPQTFKDISESEENQRMIEQGAAR